MPVTRTLRSSLGEHNAQIGTSGSAIELPLAKTREIRQAAMGSPYAPASPQAKASKTSPISSPAARRPEFGALVPNGLPGGVRAKFVRTESMPAALGHSSSASDNDEEDSETSQDDDAATASAPVSTRTRTAKKQASASPTLPTIDQLSTSTTTSTSPASHRRSGAVKRSAAESNSSSASGRNGTGSSSTRRGDNRSAHDEDDDEEDDGRHQRRRSSRIGGCSSQSETRGERDDSNKENIAPLNYRRSEFEIVIESPRRPTQNGLGARTRTMTRRSVSSPVIHFSTNSPTAAAVNVRRSARRSGLARTDSFGAGPNADLSIAAPTTPSRRGRAAPLSPAVNESAIPASPFARLNIGAGPSVLGLASSISNSADDAESSYFSSQGSGSVAPSVFDSTSQFAEDDLDMDDLSYLAGSRGYLPTTRRTRGRTTDGSQESSIYSRASSIIPDIEVLPEVSGAEESGEDKAPAATAETLQEDVEMQDSNMAEDSNVGEVVNDKSAKPKYPNIYAHARALLHFGSTTADETTKTEDADSQKEQSEQAFQIVGRDAEAAAIKSFLSARFASETLFTAQSSLSTVPTKVSEPIAIDTSAPSLYICGLPGTGKTALVRSILSELRQAGDGPTTRTKSSTAPRIAFVNCMSIRAPRLIFGRILNQLGEEVPDDSDVLSTEAEDALTEVLKSSTQDILIVLDEIDHLLEKRVHQNVLQRLFCLGKAGPFGSKAAKCAMIGIANSLDLTERFMPLLASTQMAPTILHMRPFAAQDIANVIRSRLSGLHARYDLGPEEEAEPAQNGENAIFMKPALDLACKRIAAKTGDLRRALDVCRLAVELVEGEQRQVSINVHTTEETANKVVAAELLAPLTPETAPRVTPANILRVFNSVMASSEVTKVRQLNMQAKFFLLAYLVAERRRAEGLPVLGSADDDKLNRAVGGVGTPKAGLRLLDVRKTYERLVKNHTQFATAEESELLQIAEQLECAGVLTRPDGDGTGPSIGGGGAAAAGKRAAQKTHPSVTRVVNLFLSQEDVLDGITTVAPISSSAPSSNGAGRPASMTGAAAAAGGGTSSALTAVVAETISSIWRHEETRILRCRGWEAAALESEAIRREELGGGRGYQPIGL